MPSSACGGLGIGAPYRRRDCRNGDAPGDDHDGWLRCYWGGVCRFGVSAGWRTLIRLGGGICGYDRHASGARSRSSGIGGYASRWLLGMTSNAQSGPQYIWLGSISMGGQMYVLGIAMT